MEIKTIRYVLKSIVFFVHEIGHTSFFRLMSITSTIFLKMFVLMSVCFPTPGEGFARKKKSPQVGKYTDFEMHNYQILAYPGA